MLYEKCISRTENDKIKKFQFVENKTDIMQHV